MKYIRKDSHPKIRQTTAMLTKDTAYQTEMGNIIYTRLLVARSIHFFSQIGDKT
jgi:hypothetical protein